MYLEELVETALGLILVFLVMSLAVMQIQEVISGWLRLRSNHLDGAIRSMLTDQKKRLSLVEKFKNFLRWWNGEHLLPPAVQNPGNPAAPPQTGSDRGLLARLKVCWRYRNRLTVPFPTFVDRLYEHPLIRSLGQPGRRPSYIPADKFALVLFDTIMSAGTEASVIQDALEKIKANQMLIRDLRICSLLETREVRDWLDSLIDLAGKAAADQANKILQVTLRDEIDRFTCLYSDFKPLINALIQEQSPRDGLEVLDRVKTGSEILLVDYPELKQALDSLIREAENSAKGVLTQQILNELKGQANSLAGAEQSLKDSLDSLVDRAAFFMSEGEDLLAKTRRNVEKWFNDTMDRSSGWYKRNALALSFVIGFLLALILNVDAIAIGLQLWREPTLRQSMASMAENYQPPANVDSNDFGKVFESLQNELNVLQIDVGWKYNLNKSSPEECSPGLRDPETNEIRLYFVGQCLSLVDPPANTQEWFTKLFGILLIGGAAAQGAPFWFDILGKVMNIRSAGAKPSKEQPSGGAAGKAG